jgi:hypothetical protein
MDRHAAHLLLARTYPVSTPVNRLLVVIICGKLKGFGEGGAERVRKVDRQTGTSRDVVTCTNETCFCGASVGGVMRTRGHVITELQKI